MNLATLIAPKIFVNLFSALSADAFHPDLRMFAFSLSGVCLFGNDKFAEDHGKTQKQIIGMSSGELGVDAAKIRRVTIDGDEAIAESIIHLPAGPRKVTGKMIPIYDEKMVVVGVTGSYMPIMRPRWRDCDACRDSTELSLDVALAMLTPVQMASYHEQTEALQDERMRRQERP